MTRAGQCICTSGKYKIQFAKYSSVLLWPSCSRAETFEYRVLQYMKDSGTSSTATKGQCKTCNREYTTYQKCWVIIIWKAVKLYEWLRLTLSGKGKEKEFFSYCVDYNNHGSTSIYLYLLVWISDSECIFPGNASWIVRGREEGRGRRGW